MSVTYLIIGLAGGLAAGAGAAVFFMSRSMKSKQKKVDELIAAAEEDAKRIRKEAELSVKSQMLTMKEDFEKSTTEAKDALRNQEKRLEKREDNLDKKLELLSKKETYMENQQQKNSEKERSLSLRERELNEMIEEEKEKLQQISGLSREEAKKLILQRLESELTEESAKVIKEHSDRVKEEADNEAKNIVSLAISRCSTNHSSDNLVSTVDLPNDSIKGRIIGREGRNIRAFESCTGIDVIVDDTPGVVVVSGFDNVRREIARRTMEKLVIDGRIHPARIEELTEKTRQELGEEIREIGKQTIYDLDLQRINPYIVELIGKLKFRTSYGQNMLKHSIEVAQLSGIMAGELKLDSNKAKWAGLLHDLGKAVDQESEGSHPQIGADIAKRYNEESDIINAIAAHHEDCPMDNMYSPLVMAADAISAARPGARRETLEKYIKRLERLEEVASGFQGVDTAFAIQAGREVRVIVDSKRINDKESAKICRDIKNAIEKELNYPGEIKVTLIREVRVQETAR